MKNTDCHLEFISRKYYPQLKNPIGIDQHGLKQDKSAIEGKKYINWRNNLTNWNEVSNVMIVKIVKRAASRS